MKNSSHRLMNYKKKRNIIKFHDFSCIINCSRINSTNNPIRRANKDTPRDPIKKLLRHQRTTRDDSRGEYLSNRTE